MTNLVLLHNNPASILMPGPIIHSVLGPPGSGVASEGFRAVLVVLAAVLQTIYFQSFSARLVEAEEDHLVSHKTFEAKTWRLPLE